MQSNYSELLRHPFWQRKRLEIMQRDNFKCIDCGNGNDTLNVHHEKYLPGRKPWEYEDRLLSTLCERCHTKRHMESLPEDDHLKTIGAVLSDFKPTAYLQQQYDNFFDANNKQEIDVFTQKNIKNIQLKYLRELAKDDKVKEVEAYCLSKFSFVNDLEIIVTAINTQSVEVITNDLGRFMSFIKKYFTKPITIKVTANEEIKKTA